MALEGELAGLTGTRCSGCGVGLELRVCQSAAGYYLGYTCERCGPYSRETGYYVTEHEAIVELAFWKHSGCEPANLRTTNHVKGEDWQVYVFDSFDEFRDAMVKDDFEEFKRED